MAYSKAQGKATQKYLKENKEEVRFWVKKGERALLKEEAEKNQQSMTQYIIHAINEKAGRQLLAPADQKEGE